MLFSVLPARRGQTLIEYALAIMLIAIVAIGILGAVGVKTSDMFAGINSGFGGSGSGGSGGPESTACASGFEPGSTVTISYAPTSGDPTLPAGSFEVTADENGEITECGTITIPVAVDGSSYEQTIDGLAPGGAPVSTTIPATVASPAAPNDELADSGSFGAITFNTPASSLGTMTVRVRDCSRIYHRAEPTMASYGYLLDPGYTFEVYATNGWWNNSFSSTITGGTWPTYTCDGGSSNTWYQLTDGSGYVFTGGVDVVPGSIVPGAVTYPAAAGWPGTWTAGAGEDGSGAMVNSNATTYGPRFPATPGNNYALQGTIRGTPNGMFGICFYDAADALIGSCSAIWTEQSDHFARLDTPTVTAPANAASYGARLNRAVTYDNMLSFENGVPGPVAAPDWANQVPIGFLPSTTQTFDSAATAGWPGTRTAGIGQDGSAAMRTTTGAWSAWHNITGGDTIQIRIWIKGSNNDRFDICFYDDDRFATRCTGYWTEYTDWGIYDSATFTVAASETLLRVRFTQALDYDNLQFSINGASLSEPAWANPPLAATNFGPFDFNSGAEAGMPGTWGATAGPDASGAMTVGGGYNYTRRYTAVAGHSYQGIADVKGANNRQFGICFYNANNISTWCGAVWTESTAWLAASTPAHVAGANEISYALFFRDSMSYDNLRATDNGS